MLELLSPLTPSECLGRLRAVVDPQWKLFGSKPVLGSVTASRFWGCRRIYYGNSYRTFIFARFLTEPSGSKINIRFGISPFVFLFMCVWFGLGFLVGLGMLYSAISSYSHGNAPPYTWVFLVFPWAILGAGYGMLRFGRWLARNEKAFLLDFLRKELSAT